MKNFAWNRFIKRFGRLSAYVVLAGALACSGFSVYGAQRPPATADHSKFEALQGPFENAREVTEACLGCHTEAGEQIRATTHWTWTYEHPETGQTLGKSKVINSFCGMAITNEPRCTSCHVGYGWEDMGQPPPTADFRIADRVNPYLIKDRFYQKAAKIWFQYLQLW